MMLNDFKPGSWVLAIVGVMLVLFLAAETRNTLQEFNYIGKSERDTISIQGEGKAQVRPDVTIVELGVTTDGKTVEAIQKENTNKMNEILKAVKALGVEEKDIQTQQYSIYPQYNWNEGVRQDAGFQIDQRIKIKVRDEMITGSLIAKSAELGANQIGGLQFEIDDPSLFEQAARRDAIKDARDKAQALADELGLTLVRVVSFSESSGGTPIMPRMYAMEAMDGVGGGLPAPQIEPGEQEVISFVNVVFEVR